MAKAGKKYKLAIFDMDGTVLDTIADIANSVNHVLEAHGYKTHALKEFFYFVGHGARELIKRALPQGVEDTEIEKMLIEYNAYYTEHAEDFTKPYDKTEDTLKTLKENGVRLAIFSNKPDGNTKMLAKKYFGDLFDVVYGAREGHKIKPDPQGLFEIAKEIGVGLGDVIYIGDSGVDMRTGKNAGVYTVGAEWGFRERKELEENGADTIISSITELIDIVLGE